MIKAALSGFTLSPKARLKIILLASIVLGSITSSISMLHSQGPITATTSVVE